jgi:uncharacterized membrane protein
MPPSVGFFLILAAAGLLVIGLLGFDVLSDACRHLGISPGWMAIILAAALVGGTINVPVATLRASMVRDVYPDEDSGHICFSGSRSERIHPQSIMA